MIVVAYFKFGQLWPWFHVQCLHVPLSSPPHTVDYCPCCMLLAGFILWSWLIFLRLGLVCSDDSVYCCRTHPSLTVRKLSKGSSLQSRPLVPLNLSLLERYSLPCPYLPIGPRCSFPSLPQPAPLFRLCLSWWSSLTRTCKSSVRLWRRCALPAVFFY